MKRLLLAACAATLAVTATAASSWCLGLSGLGPIRAGMTVEQVMRLADFSGLERKNPAGECWYLNYRGGSSAFRPPGLPPVSAREGEAGRRQPRGCPRKRPVDSKH